MHRECICLLITTHSLYIKPQSSLILHYKLTSKVYLTVKLLMKLISDCVCGSEMMCDERYTCKPGMPQGPDLINYAPQLSQSHHGRIVLFTTSQMLPTKHS